MDFNIASNEDLVSYKQHEKVKTLQDIIDEEEA